MPLVTFLGVLASHPNAQIEFVVRNFNTIEPEFMGRDTRRLSTYLIASLPDDRKRDDWYKYRVFSKNANLSRILPADMMEKLRASKTKQGAVTLGAFVHYGQDISNTLKRRIVIVHKMGGDPPEFEDVETFDPQ